MQGISILEHLKDLDCSSPSSWRKLIAAWDGLNVETQIIFLKHIEINETYNSQKRTLYEQALDNHNAYIRYLAAKWLTTNDPSSGILKRIQNDSNPLVKYSQYESMTNKGLKTNLKDNLELFWSLPSEGRLAFIRYNTKEAADLLVAIVKEAIKEAKTTNSELEEILSDFVSQERLQECYYNQHNLKYKDWITDNSTELEKLWGIVSLLPEGIGEKYVEKLPIKTETFFKISEEFTNKLSDFHLKILLYRNDVELQDFRKNIFFDETKDQFLKWAAVSCNFDLDIDEFVVFLKQPRKKKNGMLSLDDLGSTAENLSLWIYQAIIDEIKSIQNNSNSEWTYIPWVKFNLKRRMEYLKNNYKSWHENQITKLKLYLLAGRVFDNKDYSFNDPEMSFLDKHIVYKDKWTTFSNFVKAWNFNNNKLGNYLPYVYQINDDGLDLIENTGSKDDAEESPIEAKLLSLTKQLEKHSKYMLGIIFLLFFVLFVK